jgi:pSer/pThr/pTyr-binding forkhead associated (FHA) protein
MAMLQILTGIRKGQSVALRENRTVLGRNPDCDVVIDEINAGRRHAVIIRVGEDYQIEDGDGQGSESRGGTYVNQQRVPFRESIRLLDGDQIHMGSFVCIFCCDTEDAAHAGIPA